MARVVLFIKGSLFKPRDEYSRLAIELLETANVRFTTFDVLLDGVSLPLRDDLEIKRVS